MAEKAQAEPTMEEILASIRKIIADDSDARPSPAAKAAAAEKPSVEMKDSDDFDDLSLDDVLESSSSDLDDLGDDGIEDFESISSEEGDDILSDVDEEMFEELAAKTESESTPEPAPTFEQELEDFGLDSVSLDDEAPVIEDPDPEEDWTVGGDIDLIDEEPAAAPVLEKELNQQQAAMSAPAPAPESKPATSDEGLTDERIAGAAASALGKLMVKQNEDGGSATTIEGLMRELLRPMLKEWLDANLPAIVERKVEEEVQRIARMAR